MTITFDHPEERKVMQLLANFIAQDVDDDLKSAHIILQSALDAKAQPDVEVVPKSVSAMAEAMESGKTIIGGIRAGKTWAAQIASAKPAIKQLSNPNAGVTQAYPNGRWASKSEGGA